MHSSLRVGRTPSLPDAQFRPMWKYDEDENKLKKKKKRWAELLRLAVRVWENPLIRIFVRFTQRHEQVWTNKFLENLLNFMHNSAKRQIEREKRKKKNRASTHVSRTNTMRNQQIYAFVLSLDIDFS